MATIEKPEGLEQEHLEYLDNLRESGEVNMLLAKHYLASAFDIDYPTARKYLLYWMKTFGERHAEQE